MIDYGQYDLSPPIKWVTLDELARMERDGWFRPGSVEKLAGTKAEVSENRSERGEGETCL